MDETTKAKIIQEFSKIDLLLEKSALMVVKCKAQKPDFYDLNAIGSIIHSYYNGIESIFVLIYKSFNSMPLNGNMWHRDLLNEMLSETDVHKKILAEELRAPLKEYMGFRHVFRHSYGYELDWERLEPLFFGMTENWTQVKSCLKNFIEM